MDYTCQATSPLAIRSFLAMSIAVSKPVTIAQNNVSQCVLLPQMANRHGCITGATGTGKTVSMQVLAEAFSRMGTAVFMADVKGDFTGVAQAGELTESLQKRLQKLTLPAPAWGGFPVTLWDVFGEQGHPVRASPFDMRSEEGRVGEGGW